MSERERKSVGARAVEGCEFVSVCVLCAAERQSDECVLVSKE